MELKGIPQISSLALFKINEASMKAGRFCAGFVPVIILQVILGGCFILKDPKERGVQNYYANREKLEQLVSTFLSQKRIHVLRLDGEDSFRINDTEVDISEKEIYEAYVHDRPQRSFENVEQVLTYYGLTPDTLSLFKIGMRALDCKSIGFAMNNPQNVELGFGTFPNGPGAYGLIYVPEGSTEKAIRWRVDYYRIEPIEARWFYYCE